MTMTAKHWNNRTDLNIVRTGNSNRAAAQLTHAVGLNSIVSVHGAPGTGKTFSTHVTLTHLAQRTGRTLIWQVCPPEQSMKAIVACFAKALGVRVHPRASHHEVLELLLEHLATPRDLIVVFDEFHQLTPKGLQQIRYLHDRCSASSATAWPLILIGSKARKLLREAPDAASRVGAWIDYNFLDETEMLTAVRAWNADLADLDAHTLLDLYPTLRGEWRRWAIFADAFLTLKHAPATAGADDTTLVAAALEAIGMRS